MKELKIYLAGPMDRVSNDEMCAWREKCHMYFQMFEGVRLLDPTRRPHEDDMNSREIFNEDLNDVRDSDLLLVDTRDLGKPQFGTPCEVFYASYILNKTVLGWFDLDHDPRKHKRIFQEVLLTNEFESLEKALEHIEVHYAS
jgi:nucleoside 2-deoxyribosyltransferase